ncbi:hypothetical protein SAMN06265365_11188 [Tistlia consotensis]|uniref:Uncharacterized protein n=1 Tax=Tistlia consotensis USBA 355 TaxID=560819 RepID=A0A1Y6C2C3_9PROT|nr:hypothetical protein [Tistlia consotensis]SMF33044.1 hypothetical protein SAMN05428998_11189 [Tistlia consotensis USBA 355]SNR69222.1 hypothetical protein SAMN06265365_11188 [Tistlia consotensis]
MTSESRAVLPPAGMLSQARAEPPRQAAGQAASGRAIVHPLVDFLCLGGGSLLVLPLVMAAPASAVPALVALMWMLADVLNHPHFAASYQIFYRGYREKAFGGTLPRPLRRRYLVAGIAVPAVLAGWIAASFLAGSAYLLGLAGNLMLLLVGWHYVKQGYGMLMVDAVYRRRFFGRAEKRVLLWNAYACWILFWLAMNAAVAERKMWGISYYAVEVPHALLLLAFCAAVATTTMTLVIFARRLLGGGGLPVNGAVAYLTTLYAWALARFNPLTILFVPALHSLQYLTIVWRFEKNRAALRAAAGAAPQGTGASDARNGRRQVLLALARFGALAAVMGLAGFWWLPRLLGGSVGYDHEQLGGTAFMFAFWIFINVHHYFIDNVIWRSDNPETAKALFGTGR